MRKQFKAPPKPKQQQEKKPPTKVMYGSNKIAEIDAQQRAYAMRIKNRKNSKRAD